MGKGAGGLVGESMGCVEKCVGVWESVWGECGEC